MAPYYEDFHDKSPYNLFTVQLFTHSQLVVFSHKTFFLLLGAASPLASVAEAPDARGLNILGLDAKASWLLSGNGFKPSHFSGVRWF